MRVSFGASSLRVSIVVAGVLAGGALFADTAVRVSDINPGAGSSGQLNPTFVFNGKLYFSAGEPVAGDELYAYDGVNPPVLVADLAAGALDSSPRDFVIYNGQLHFVAANTAGVRQIWKYDGTNPPTVAVALGAASNPQRLVVFGTRLVFQATTVAFGEELWSWDGTNPPAQVADIRPGNLGALGNHRIAVFGSRVLFPAFDGGTHGQEIWQWNGVDPPAEIGDLKPGAGSSIVDFDDEFAILNGVLFFGSTDPLSSGNTVLWRWDGVSAPATVGMFDLEGGIGIHNGAVYFTALNLDPANMTEREIWRYDGVNPPTRIAPGTQWGITFTFQSHNGFLYFYALSGFVANIYKYDGVNPPVLDPNAWTLPDRPEFGLTPFNGFLYLRAVTLANGRELWRITTSGIAPVTPTPSTTPTVTTTPPAGVSTPTLTPTPTTTVGVPTVAPSPNPGGGPGGSIPTLSEWALAGFALLLAGAGILVTRR